MNKSPEISASELVLSAIFFLQQKNGVTASEITKFICDKRKCKPTQVKGQVKKALDRAIKNGIFSRKRGLYRIENGFGEKVNALRRRERQQTYGRKKGKSKKSKNVAPLKKKGLKNIECEGGMNSFKNNVFQASASVENNFPIHRFEVFENKTEAMGDDDRSNSSDSREGHISLKGVKRDVALDKEEYEDEDFSEEDEEDDDIDYFAEEQFSNTRQTLSASGSRKKSPAMEKNDSSDSEGHGRCENKKRKVTKVIDTSVKRKRRRAADAFKGEENKNNYEEGRRDRIGGKKRNKTLHEDKRNSSEENRHRYEDDRSENNNSGDSEEDKRDSADKKESDFSNEDSDSDNISLVGNENDQENTRSLDKNGNAQKECQKEEGKMKELPQNLQEDFQQQKKDVHNPLQNDVGNNNSKDNPDPKEIKECEKQTLSEPHLTAPQTPPVQANIPPTDGCDSRFSHLRSAQKRIACKEKIMSESKSTKRSRCK